MSEREALEQIAIVCTDNMDRDCDHRMALNFVRQVANEGLVRARAASVKEPASASFDMTRTALEAARDYLVEEANSGSVWSSIGSAKALAAIDAALSVTRPDRGAPGEGK